MDYDTGAIMDRLVTAGLVNVKRRSEYTGERAVSGAAPYVVTVVITEELTSTDSAAEQKFVAAATRSGRSRTATGAGTTLEAAITALDLTLLD